MDRYFMVACDTRNIVSLSHVQAMKGLDGTEVIELSQEDMRHILVLTFKDLVKVN